MAWAIFLLSGCASRARFSRFVSKYCSVGSCTLFSFRFLVGVMPLVTMARMVSPLVISLFSCSALILFDRVEVMCV